MQIAKTTFKDIHTFLLISMLETYAVESGTLARVRITDYVLRQ